MNIRKITTITGIVTMIPLTLPAAWTILDDFQGYSPDTNFEVPAETFGYVQFDVDIEAPKFYIYDEPIGGENYALFVDANASNTSVYGTVWVQFPIPEAAQIPAGGIGTIYHRVLLYGTSNEVHFCVADLYDSGTGSWGDHCAITRVSYDNPIAGLEARSGGTYPDSNPLITLETNEWYQIWLHLDNSAATYKIYVQGPNDSTPQEIVFENSSTLNFRTDNYSGQSLKNITIGTSSGAPNNRHSNEPWVVDDIAVFPGEYRTDVPSGSSGSDWCGYPLTDGVHADTGDFLGWVFAADGESSSWVYVWKISSWVYFPDCPTSSGGWSYIAN